MEFVLKFRLDSVSKFFQESGGRRKRRVKLEIENKIIVSRIRRNPSSSVFISLLRKLLHAFCIAVAFIFEILKMGGIIRR